MKCKNELFAAQCLKCGRYDRDTAAMLKVKAACVCAEPYTIRCAGCSWCGPAHKRTKRSCFLVIDCPKCGRAVQRLTAEKRKMIEAETGRAVGDNSAIVHRLMRDKFRFASGELKRELVSAGMAALVIAAIRWDASLSVKFVTYATSHVYGRMRHAYRDWGRRIELHAAYLEHARKKAVNGYVDVHFELID